MGGELPPNFEPSEDREHFDPSLLIKPDGLTESTAETLSSSTSTESASVKDDVHLGGEKNVAVYKFMHVCSDNQNGGLVNKIVLPPAEIKRFCNDIAANR